MENSSGLLHKNNTLDSGSGPCYTRFMVNEMVTMMDDFDMLTPEDLADYDRWNAEVELAYQHWLTESDDGIALINEWAAAAALADAADIEMENV